MMNKCGVSAAVVVMDAVAAGEMARGRASTAASSTAATASSGRAKRRKTGVGEGEPLKRSSNDLTCAQLMSSNGCRKAACATPVPIAVAESLRIMSCSEDQASVSRGSSYGSSETGEDNLRFADLEEDCSEADSTETFFKHERSEKTPSSQVAEEEPETMSSSEAKQMEPNPLQRLQDSQSSSLDIDLDGLSGKIGKPALNKPSDFEIEEFFAAAEAENLLELERFKNKYNFDFVKEKPLEGRFTWRQISPMEKVSK
ncbi:hypothetical protein SAY86_013554 [Trapa natans]|uniref:Cyclin-dependent kinase inhibitor domain-containing protein n=1 Tax=Trapa natans TaxID=22666 RepID=A0AAN7KUT7_TRANT|nr:hypothetical protein SAY86_013554 [Trapa natans]